MLRLIKRLLIGTPLPTHESSHQRLSNAVALAVFASDALSSVAYATEEILVVLVAARAVGGVFILGVTFSILGLLAIVVASYRQTIEAYPSGGGAYIVARENLGTLAGLTAGAALLVDYVLTAAVSVAAGVSAITSAFPEVESHKVALAGGFLLVIIVLNLRGVRESGRAFAFPTYGFVISLLAMIVWGLARRPFVAVAPMPPELGAVTAPGLLLLMRAFASGCTALTGVEAVSNGVQAFEPPEADNANRTLVRLGSILAVLFTGITVLALLYRVVPSAQETVVSQIARHAFGSTPLYYVVQVTTALILVLAANTSFAGFPRLASLMAEDWFLPRQLSNQGDRLAFSNGILLLGLLSWILIPLYAVGVFLSFTLSQSGMVVHWLRERSSGYGRRILINLVGALATGAVLAVVVATKFAHGAWIVCVVIPGLVIWLRFINRHYVRAAEELRVERVASPGHLPEHVVVIPVSGIHRGVVRALEYARSLTTRIRAVTVSVDSARSASLRVQWAAWAPEIPLDVVESPYRSLVTPLIEYVARFEGDSGALVTVVIPEFVPRRLWHRFLHNQTALLLVAALSARPNVVVTTVRISIDG